jgi:ADP-ribosyl-[dinitrogen reductase] hydrolase
MRRRAARLDAMSLRIPPWAGAEGSISGMGEIERHRGCLLGLAAGDAVGTTVEFKRPGTFEPVTDMEGGGVFRLRPGQWTDDTSMALCLATSLVERGGFDARDQMQRYCRWADEGYLSSTGTCFDIGNTVRAALERFRGDGDPYAGSTDPASAGNGSIMRLAPVPMWACPDPDAAERYAAMSSRTTHAAPETIDACRLLARMLVRALLGRPRDDVLLADAGSFRGSERIAAIARGEYLDKAETEVRGSGYVVESLEAALWAFARTGSFRDAVLAAANLGDDADTTAAVCGQIAGAYYGEEGVPPVWRERLALRGEIERLAEALEGMHAEPPPRETR